MENRTPQSSRHVFLLRDLGLDFTCRSLSNRTMMLQIPMDSGRPIENAKKQAKSQYEGNHHGSRAGRPVLETTLIGR